MSTQAPRRVAAAAAKAAFGLGGLAALIAWSGGACTAKVGPGRLDAPPGEALPAGALLYTVRVERVCAAVPVVGTVESVEKISLSSRLSAYVKQVSASAGDRVKKGQLLAALDDREIQEQLAAAEAQFRQAETEHERTKQLMAKGAATDQMLVSAQSAFQSARARVEGARVMLTYAQIVSPIDGVVTERRVEAGDLANQGQVLLAVYDPRRMRLEAPVPVRLVDKLKLEQPVQVTLDRPAKTVGGKVTEIVSEVDPQSRTQKVKILLTGVEGDVLPGTFGRLLLEDEPRDTVLAPAAAVYRAGQIEQVQVAANGRVVRRMVKTGPRIGDRVEVLSGLEAGCAVLAAPVMKEE